MMKRILRIAGGFEEAAEIDRRDVAAMSFEERISGVERLRRVWVGEDRAESRLDRVLVCADRPTSAVRPRRRLREALIDFGFGAAVPEAEELARPDRIIMLGQKPWRIDILTGIDDVSFDEAWATRVEADFVAKPLYVIGRDMLLRNKRAAGRDKDLLDVSMLEAHASPRPLFAAKKRAAKKRAAKKKAAKKKKAARS
jgi:hypothetical protein